MKTAPQPTLWLILTVHLINVLNMAAKDTRKISLSVGNAKKKNEYNLNFVLLALIIRDNNSGACSGAWLGLKAKPGTV